ncbi:TonB-dependent receptor [Flavobacterium jejuense]|uniref:TonB-dependent receptor n=1 Tax=Flavobacterium jejuense TaxID=1544455 RepID=A0ABX0ISC0_9FLAO|nr:TonB-dependent receptor [Flavobacterium jejuense]NHN24735.1 TonB-dependent receptor [Flavobacterium jejuense]
MILLNQKSTRFFIIFFLFTALSFGQLKTIKGKVTDKNGLPIPGASVFIKNSKIGTNTDFNGLFELQINTDPKAILVISYVGMIEQEVPLGDETYITIALLDNVESLKEIIVIGYGTQKKSDLTGAVSVIDGDNFESRSTGQIGNLIQGQTTGVQVLTSSGKPSQGLSIRIRGTSSILSGSEPLYVVDGVPTTDTRSINPSDIESISVLKDAASAAIYGANGANGVVLITTKKGTTSKPKVSYDSYIGVSQVWKTLKVLNGEQYRDLMGELGLTTDWNTYNKNTDWQNEIFQDGYSFNNQFSFSGKTEGTNYYVSAGNIKQEGAVKSAELNRLNFKINLDQKINDWLSAGTRISYTKYSDIDVKDNTSVNSGGVLLGALTTPSVIGVYNANGSFTSNPFQNWENPLASTDGLEREYNNTRFLANLFFEAKFLKDFKFKTNYGIDNSNGVYESFLDPNRTGYGRAIKGQAIRTTNTTDYYIFDNTITYSKTIGNHKVEGLVGSVIQKFKFDNSNMETRNFASATITTPNGGSELIAATASKSEKSNTAFISRLNYSFNDKYLLTANFRADGSSVFGPNKRWGYFPSVSVGWKISNENFLRENTLISNLKVRASYGIVGNDQIRNYAYLGIIGSGANYPIGGSAQPGTYPGTIENFNLKWEESTQKNIGIDFSILNNRVQLTADAYIKNTKDLLLEAPLPTTTGFDRAVQNIGEVQNKGLELGLKTVNVDTNNFKWNSTFNISFNKNEVINLVGEELYLGDIAGRGGAILVKEGLPLGSFFGYVYGGVDPTSGNAYYIDKNGASTFNPSEDDRVIIGDANPDFIYSINNSFSYKGIGLQIFLQGTYGNDMLNATRIETEGMTDPKNQSIEVLNRWRQPGDITDIPRASFGNTDNSRLSTRFIEDASYLRFKAITLSYDFNQNTLEKLNLSNLRFYVTGENLITLTNYSGFDPEVNAFGGSNTVQGIDYGTYPQSRTILFGFNITF